MPRTNKKRTLCVCMENAGRSQMAGGFAKKYGLSAMSAGTMPANKANPAVVQVMKEEGIDLSSSTPRALTRGVINEADLVATMGAQLKKPAQSQSSLRCKGNLLTGILTTLKGKVWMKSEQ